MDRSRFTALAILAAVAGTVSVGIAVLAHAGLCLHRLGWFGSPDSGMAAMPGMSATGTMAPGTLCPALLYASLVAGILCLFALIVLVAMRPCASRAAVTAARVIVGLRVGPLTGLLCLAGSVPLTVALAVDGDLVGTGPLIGAPLLLLAAALSAFALVGCARAVLALARRLVVTIIAAFQLLAPSAQTPWFALRTPILVAAGVRLARRRPSRAPPVC